MLKSQEISNCHKPLSQNGKMGDTEPSDNTLYKTNRTRSGTLSYTIGQDPVATSYLVG